MKKGVEIIVAGQPVGNCSPFFAGIKTETLKELLRQAVEAEEYEDAKVLSDEIKVREEVVSKL